MCFCGGSCYRCAVDVIHAVALHVRSLAQVRPAASQAADPMLELLYDPMLNCYYDQRTSMYYELKV